MRSSVVSVTPPKERSPADDPAPRLRRPLRRPDIISLGTLSLLVIALVILEVSVLDRRPLANDEATSYFIAHVDWSSFWESLVTSEANGSLFYLLLRFWLGTGSSEALLRVLPMLFAIATVPVLFAATRRLFGPMAAVIAAALLSTNVMFLEHGQDLRSYSLSALLVTLSGWFFIRGLSDPSIANRAGHVVAGTLAMYAHFFSALVLLAQFVAALLYPDRRRSLRLVVPNMALVGLLVSPLAAFVLAGDRGQVDWIPPLSPTRIRSAMLDLSGMPNLGGLVLLAAVIVIGLAVAVWQRPPGPVPVPDHAADAAFEARAWRLAFALLWFVLPIAGALLISIFKPLFVSRYLLIALPGLALATAVAVASLRQRFLVAATTALLLVLAVVEVGDWYPKTIEGGFAYKADYVRTHAQPRDAIAFYAPTIIRPFGYYAGYYTDRDAAPPEVIYPDKYWLGYSRTRFTPPLSRIASDVDGHDRVWLVVGAALDRPRVAERDAMVNTLKRECPKVTHPVVGVRLFSGC